MAKDEKKTKLPSYYGPIIPVFIILATIIICLIASNISSNAKMEKSKKTKSESIITNILINSKSDKNYIDNITGTLLEGSISLDKFPNSMLVVSVDIKNIYEEPISFNGLVGDYEDKLIYSNDNIICTYENIDIDEIILPGESKTINLIFKYKDQDNISDNTLKFYLNISFKKISNDDNKLVTEENKNGNKTIEMSK